MSFIRKKIKNIVFKNKFFRNISTVGCGSSGLMPSVVVRTPPSQLKDFLFLPEFPYKTQLNQDIFALLVNRFQPGFFLEIGANDGFTLSNTAYLEEHFGWNGILVEANPQYESSLKKRKSNIAIYAVVGAEGDYKFRSAGLYGGVADFLDKTHEDKTEYADTITVKGVTLKRILKENGAPDIIGFISIDVEGGEVDIVKQMCELEGYRFVCGCIEYNAREDDYLIMKELLSNAGYEVVWEKQTGHDLFFIDRKR